MDEGRPRPWDRRVSPKTLLRKGVLRNGTETLSEERVGGGGKENICALCIYSEPRSLPIILHITRCLGKRCSETIFVTRENGACAFVPLGESMKWFFPCEPQRA